MSAPPIDPAHAPPLAPEIAEAIAERIAQRDLPGALEVARAAPQGEVITAVLARLVMATERMLEDTPLGGARNTIPLGGHALALFQLRMGNLDDAEDGFRRLVLEQPSDGLALERLHDVLQLRRAIEAPTASSGFDDPTEIRTRSPSAPAGWLDKRNARPAAAGWAPSVTAKQVASSRPPPKNEWDEEVATNVIRPEQEAELLLRGGSPERALAIYRTLFAGNPQRPGIATRIAEIERIVAHGAGVEERASFADEATVRRDVATLGAAPDARRSTVAQAPAATPADDEHVTVRRIVRVK